jgi:tau tubulin kinase
MSPEQHFSINTAVGVGIQCLEALQDLHSIGYLHRDVKPSNIATGRAEIGELQKIYMLDFGMARKYVKEDHPPFTIRHARERAEFRGTVRYAAISCHIGREQSRKDDCESWLYMLIELTNGRLPWCEEDMAQVGLHPFGYLFYCAFRQETGSRLLAATQSFVLSCSKAARQNTRRS